MTFPGVFGFTPCGDGDLRAETHELARRLEGEGAYSRDPDSAHDRELLAEAELAAMPRQRLDAVDANLLPDRAGELLDAWEDALDIPNNAARSTDERRVRASAYASLPQPASLDAVNDLLERLGLDAVNILDTSTWTLAAGATVTTGQADPEGGTGAVLVTDADAGQYSSAYLAGVFHHAPARVSFSAWVKKDTGATHYPELQVANTVQLRLHLGTGSCVPVFGGDRIESLTVLEEVSGWWRIRLELVGCIPIGIGNELRFTVIPALGAAADHPTGFAVTTVGSVTVFDPRIEGGVIRRASRARVVQEDATAETVLQSVVLIADEQYDTPKIAGNVDILARVLPSRALGAWMREGDLDEMLVTSITPKWGGSEKLGRSALGSSSPSQRDHVRTPARYRDYGPFSRLTAADLNATQDAALFRRDDRAVGTWTNAIQIGAANRFFDFTVGNLATAEIDTSIDWRERLVFVALKFAAATDIRPGGAQGTLYGGATQRRVHLYTGTGGTGAYRKQIETTGVYVQADAATGALQIRNESGATIYGAGLVIATGHVGGHASAPATKKQVFADGDTMPAASWYTGVRDEVYTSRANGAAVSAFASQAGAGGMRRVGALPFAERPSSGVTTHVLDFSVDWRDRIIATMVALVWPSSGSGFDSGFDGGFGAPLGAGLGPAWPGAGEVSFTETPAVFSWLSGPGVPANSTTWTAALEGGVGSVQMYARNTDGALCLDVPASAAQAAYALAFMIHASEPIGVHSTPTAVPNPTPSTTDPIYPYELNALQDGSLMGQLSEGDVNIFLPSITAPSSMPLGPLLIGPEPYLPASFTLRHHDGLTVPGDPDETKWVIHRRQRIAGGGFQLCCVANAANGTDRLVDASVDWRDRLIYLIGITEDVDFAPGQAGDTGYNTEAEISAIAYTHDGLPLGAKTSNDHAISIAGTVDRLLYVGDETAGTPGGLYLRNDSGVTAYVGMMIIASPPLGPRSKRSE